MTRHSPNCECSACQEATRKMRSDLASQLSDIHAAFARTDAKFDRIEREIDAALKQLEQGG